MKRLTAGALLLAAVLARPAAAQTRREVRGVQLWAELQAELALKNGDYLLLTLHGENVPLFNGSRFNDRVLGFDVRSAAVTYEHFWSDRWSGGASLQHASVSGFKYVAPELLLRHRSPVGPLTFGQRLGVYRTIPFGGLGRTTANDGSNFASLRLDLERLVPLGSGSLKLRPRLSYEAQTQVRLQKTQTDSDERTIQYTSLRAEVGCRLGDHLDFTPWFAYTTAYYFTIGQYNPVGNPIGGGRYNAVTPVVGFDARITLFAGKTAFERRQLPTQH